MIHVLITGTTGMVGKGVLLECIEDPQVQTITLINRSPIEVQSQKINEIILKDFMEIDKFSEQLKGVDACYHCMGVSAAGLSEEQYTKLTHLITQKLADVCFAINPEMTFIYVSGEGTDSTEKSRQMWARVKGKTENYILSKGFKNAVMFRPGFIIPENGIKSRTKIYQHIYTLMSPFFPLLKKMKSITTTTKVGRAMVAVTLQPIENITTHLSNKQINKIAANETRLKS